MPRADNSARLHQKVKKCPVPLLSRIDPLFWVMHRDCDPDVYSVTRLVDMGSCAVDTVVQCSKQDDKIEERTWSLTDTEIAELIHRVRLNATPFNSRKGSSTEGQAIILGSAFISFPRPTYENVVNTPSNHRCLRNRDREGLSPTTLQ